MSIDVTYTLDRDVDAGYLTYYINYAIEPYIDPESGEYFGDTQWSVSYYRVGNPDLGPITGYSYESGDIYLDLYIDQSSTIQNYKLFVKAWNSFRGDISAETLTWNVLTAAGATGPLTFNGTNGIDFFIGGHGVDTINGLDGNDRVDSGSGNDKIYAGGGADYINGGSGNDLMVGGAGDDTYVVDSTQDVAQENTDGGSDTVFASITWTLANSVENLILTGGSSGFDNINGTGNAANNVISGNNGKNTLNGLDGDDRIDGASGDDKLLGGAGNDVLVGGFGNDRMEGGVGDDTYYVDSTSDVVVEVANGGIDTVQLLIAGSYVLGANVENLTGYSQDPLVVKGNASNNVIIGGRGVNALLGLAGDDTLTGNISNDTLTGGVGADRLNGGDGGDMAKYSASTAGVTIDLMTGKGWGGEATGDQLDSIENVLGSAFNDNLMGNTSANRLYGAAGNDRLSGGDGNDVLDGGAGADELLGGDGIDTITYGASSASVVINLAKHTATSGDAQGDTLQSIENVLGGNGDDTIIGDSLTNVLRGNAGIDLLDGGLGNDVIGGGAGADFLNGGDGIDWLSYAGSQNGGVIIDLSINLALNGDAEGDTILAFENVEGSEMGDALTGTITANRLNGRSGDDRLDGGRGSDTLTGGSGIDRFVFGKNYGVDRAVDFSTADGDVIVLKGLGAAFDTFAEVMAVASYSGANDLAFRFSATDVVLLQGVQPWMLGSNNFEFV
jgi:Ca2+-binding RTX toxin-like protein